MRSQSGESVSERGSPDELRPVAIVCGAWRETAYVHGRGVGVDQRLTPSTAHASCDRPLYIEKGVHDYNGYFRADIVLFHAHKATYRQLGLLILAVVFHTLPETVEIELTHPASAIKRLIVESPL